jgi:hypothetical protein
MGSIANGFANVIPSSHSTLDKDKIMNRLNIGAILLAGNLAFSVNAMAQSMSKDEYKGAE